jgi:hypothetical protein
MLRIWNLSHAEIANESLTWWWLTMGSVRFQALKLELIIILLLFKVHVGLKLLIQMLYLKINSPLTSAQWIKIVHKGLSTIMSFTLLRVIIDIQLAEIKTVTLLSKLQGRIIILRRHLLAERYQFRLRNKS